MRIILSSGFKRWRVGGEIRAVKAKTRESRLLRKKSLGWRKKFIAIIFRKIF